MRAPFPSHFARPSAPSSSPGPSQRSVARPTLQPSRAAAQRDPAAHTAYALPSRCSRPSQPARRVVRPVASACASAARLGSSYAWTPPTSPPTSILLLQNRHRRLVGFHLEPHHSISFSLPPCDAQPPPLVPAHSAMRHGRPAAMARPRHDGAAGLLPGAAKAAARAEPLCAGPSVP